MHLFSPVPELRFSKVDAYTWEARSPWLEVLFETEGNFLEARARDWKSSEGQSILQGLSAFPLVRMKPRQARQKLRLADLAANRALPSVSAFLASAAEIPPSLREAVAQVEWQWPEEKEVFYGVDGGWDALSAFTSLRRLKARWHHRHDESGLWQSWLDEFQRCDGPRYLAAVRLIVRQNHFVTLQCCECLVPALNAPEPVSQLMRKFLNEERGHDKILERCLRNLCVTDPTQVVVLGSLKVMMELLRHQASHPSRHLGLACLIEDFEATSLEEVDPFAHRLSQSEVTAAAAEDIQLHHSINLNGQHAAHGFELASRLTPLSDEDLVQTLCAVESLCVLDRFYNRQMLDQFARLT